MVGSGSHSPGDKLNDDSFNFKISGDVEMPQSSTDFQFPNLVGQVDPSANEEIITVAGRRIRISTDPNFPEPSLYSLMRQWVRNDPDYEREMELMRVRARQRWVTHLRATPRWSLQHLTHQFYTYL